MATVFKALVAAAGLMAFQAGAAIAGDTGTPCRQETDDAADRIFGNGSSAKPRLFERSADPATDKRPAIARATGKLALKALAAPFEFARWIKAKLSERSVEHSN